MANSTLILGIICVLCFQVKEFPFYSCVSLIRQFWRMCFVCVKKIQESFIPEDQDLFFCLIQKKSEFEMSWQWRKLEGTATTTTTTSNVSLKFVDFFGLKLLCSPQLKCSLLKPSCYFSFSYDFLYCVGFRSTYVGFHWHTWTSVSTSKTKYNAESTWKYKLTRLKALILIPLAIFCSWYEDKTM